METRTFSDEELGAMSPKEFRSIVRRGELAPMATFPCCRGYVQANLAIIPKDLAFDFLLFCQRNPRPNPVLDVTEAGDPCPKLMAPDADLRTDLLKYRVFKNGEIIDEPTDISTYWRDDLIAFLIGCSISFDWVLQAANVKYRYFGAYTTNIECVPAGCFHGHMVVSGRFMKGDQSAVRAVQISSRHLLTHGPPIHIGDASAIGIKDIYKPDVWSPEFIPPQEPDEIAMYWGCGVTPQAVAIESKIPFMITHTPGNMFITDWLSEELAVL